MNNFKINVDAFELFQNKQRNFKLLTTRNRPCWTTIQVREADEHERAFGRVYRYVLRVHRQQATKFTFPEIRWKPFSSVPLISVRVFAFHFLVFCIDSLTIVFFFRFSFLFSSSSNVVYLFLYAIDVTVQY